MARTRVILWIGAAMVAVALLAAPPAQAGCDNPQCDPIGDGSGCCNSNCTWKDLNANCRGATDPCHTGQCNASHDCVLSNPLVNADNGKKCHRPADRCQVGECQGGVCVQDNPDGWDEKCAELDGNPCTRECEVVNNVPHCLSPTGIPAPNPCSIVSGNNCQPGECAGGSCVASGPPVICSGTPGQCFTRSCPGGVCGTTPTPGVQGCVKGGTQPNECQLTQCSNQGNCNIVDKDQGIDCTETGLCRDAACDGNGTCEQQFHAQNTPCQTANDTNSCTNQVCNTSGSCVFGSCAGPTTICEFCEAGGIPNVGCQNTVPNNLNCGCTNL